MRLVQRIDCHFRVSGVKTLETPQCLRQSTATADGSAERRVSFTATFGTTPEFLRKLVTNSGFRSGARRAYSVPPRRIDAGVPRRTEVVAGAGSDGTRSS
jgi:hypothetical protein